MPARLTGKVLPPCRVGPTVMSRNGTLQKIITFKIAKSYTKPAAAQIPASQSVVARLPAIRPSSARPVATKAPAVQPPVTQSKTAQRPAIRPSTAPPPTNRSLATKLASSKPPPRFTQSQLALALTISKSRPEGLSTAGMNLAPLPFAFLPSNTKVEYCDQLRKRIRTGKPVTDEENRYVDTADFWKDQYQRIHREKKALEDKVHRLEEEGRLTQEALEGDGDHFHDQTSLVQQLVANRIRNDFRKRKVPGDEELLQDQWSMVEMMESSVDEHLLRMSGYLLRIRRQRNNLEKITRLLGDLDYLEDTINHINQLLALLETALHDCCTPLQLMKTNDDNLQTIKLLQHITHQVKLSYHSCFVTLNEIFRTMVGRTKKDGVIYKMVVLVSKMIAFLHTCSKAQARYEHRQKVRQRQDPSQGTEQEEYIVNKHLANAVSSMISNLNWEVGQPGHCELLEGILYIILKHTGKLVSIAVFGEHVAASEQKGKISEGKIIPGKGTRFESRYIIQILYAALGGSKRTELVAQVLAAGRRTASHNRGVDLVGKTKILIQSTLLKNGTGGEKFETLREATRPADVIDDPDPVDGSIEKYSSEWLIEMAFALVGWDMVT